MIKKIVKTEDVLEKIYNAIDAVNNPVRQTLSPKGGNVIYEDDMGNQHFTNDGVTILNSINVKDPIENAIVEILKGGSRKTNIEAGDGTSSTLLASSVLIKEGLRLIEQGHNQMEVRDNLNKFALDMRKELNKMVTKVKNDSDIKFIAKISANNDDEIASNVVKIIKIVGEDGQVILDRSYGAETEIIEDAGFVIKSGVFLEELADKKLHSQMLDVPVFITDKRLYYKSEAETILQTVLNSGYNEVVIVASDFIGEALPYFIANHVNNKVRVMLVTEKKYEILKDLATYIGGEVVSDKKGMLAENVTIDNFAFSDKVFSDQYKTIIGRDKKEENKELDKRVKVLKREMKKIANKESAEYKIFEQRISSLTTGMVTIKVAAPTQEEIFEKLHRYEDSVNAARGALKEGYLPGAGVSMFRAFKKVKVHPDYNRMFTKLVEANIRQIAENCKRNPDMIIDEVGKANINFGYNANTDKVEDVLKAGIIEPFIVTKQVIANAVSIANIIITSRYIIVNDLEELKDK